MIETRNTKPLGRRAYGSIPHLPGSRRGTGDHGLDDLQARLLTVKTRDAKDTVFVQEKLDGSNVAVAKINGETIALIRAGYAALQSNWLQHHHFAAWVADNRERFEALLSEGERCVGEWLMEAHGTRYNLLHEPFVIFDIMRGGIDRVTNPVLLARCGAQKFITPRMIHAGGVISISEVLTKLEPSGHGALDPVEGAVWRIEREGKVDFLGKYVRPEKIDGAYLESVSGKDPVYNWTQ